MLLAMLSVGLLLATAVLTARAETTPAGVNGKIAFLESEDDERRAIHVINPNGTGHTRLTSNQANNVSLAWSPDGGKIAFESDGDGRDNSYDIYIINADGSGRRQLTTGGTALPAWSPDGTRIAFVNGEVYTVNPDGTGLTRISRTEVSSDPAWSPDGRQIVFVGLADGHREIFKVNADGTGQTRLTTTAHSGGFNLDYRGPTFSPDGTKIAFESNRETHCQRVECGRIYAMNADGSELKLLTNDTGGSYAPEWSPDGTRIAFFSHRDGNYELYRINADGTGETRLTNNDVGDVNHVWSPDGTKIVVERQTGPNTLYIVDADNGSERFLAPGARPDWQRFPENVPPDCARVIAAPSELFPANKKLRVVTLAGATDPDGDEVAITIDHVSQDEPVRQKGDRTSPDARRASAHGIEVRAERSPRGDGRVYRVGFTASDGEGGTCSGKTIVSVPRRKKQAAVDSAPPDYDSFGR
jgi:Tol biopolymer transport system component